MDSLLGGEMETLMTSSQGGLTRGAPNEGETNQKQVLQERYFPDAVVRRSMFYKGILHPSVAFSSAKFSSLP